MEQTTYNESTVKLLNIIHKKHKYASLEEIRECIENGANLKNIETIYGGIIYLCIYNEICPSILQYLIDNGAKDNCEKGVYFDVWFNNGKQIIDIENVVIYASPLNALVSEYNACVHSGKLAYQIANRVNSLSTFELRDDSLKEKISIEKQIDKLNLLKEYCKIINIHFDDIQTKLLDLPENIHDSSIISSFDPF